MRQSDREGLGERQHRATAAVHLQLPTCGCHRHIQIPRMFSLLEVVNMSFTVVLYLHPIPLLVRLDTVLSIA